MSDLISSRIRSLWAKFVSKEYREVFSNTQATTNIAAQIQTMREDRDWTQEVLAEKSGMAQSRISLLEDPSYERMSLSTLKRIASAFDVALVVRFAPYSEVLQSSAIPEPSRFSVKSFSEDCAPELSPKKWYITQRVYTGGRQYSATGVLPYDVGRVQSILAGALSRQSREVSRATV